MRRRFVILSLVTLFGCGNRTAVDEVMPAAPVAAAGRPNVVLVTIDTLRADRLPAYGSTRVATPHLDRFRRDAVLFEHAYSPCPLTLPAHASLLTGLLPPAHGVRDNVGYQLDPSLPNLPRMLKALGYDTVGAVSAYVLRRETGMGALFDTYLDGIRADAGAAMAEVQRPGGETTALARQWIETRSGRADGRPFFLFLHLFEPHSPYTPPEPFKSRYPDPYDGEIAAADAVAGELLDLLRSRGLYDDALIVIASDHGEGLGDHGEDEHGLLLYREALWVPLLVKLPGAARAGRAIAEPAGLVDVMPTILAALDEPVPAGLAGRPLFAPPGPPRRLYAETFYPRLHLGWSELRSLVDARFHFIDGPRPELFDLASDPRQTKSVLAENRRLYRELEAELAAIPDGFAGPGAVTDEERAKLAALGYLAAPAAAAGPLPDPRDKLPVLADLKQAFELSATGRLSEAATALGAILRENPQLQDARLQLADVERARGRHAEAVALLREAVERVPAMLPAISLQLAEVYLDMDRPTDATAHARAGLAANAGRAHLLLARAALAEKDFARADRELDSALASSVPPEVPARLVRARVRLSQDRPAEALAALEEARKLTASGPPVPWLHFLSGESLARLERLPEAEAAFRAEIAAFPRHRPAYTSLAIVLGISRRFDEIEPLLQTMVAADPTPEAFADAARALERLGNTEAASRWRSRAAR